MKKGDRFIVTTGEYSDYGIRDSFVVLKDFSFDQALLRWLNVRGGVDGSFGDGPGHGEQDFLASLRTNGYVADENLNTVHMANYSRPEPSPANDSGDEPAGDGEATPAPPDGPGAGRRDE